MFLTEFGELLVEKSVRQAWILGDVAIETAFG